MSNKSIIGFGEYIKIVDQYLAFIEDNHKVFKKNVFYKVEKSHVIVLDSPYFTADSDGNVIIYRICFPAKKINKEGIESHIIETQINHMGNLLKEYQKVPKSWWSNICSEYFHVLNSDNYKAHEKSANDKGVDFDLRDFLTKYKLVNPSEPVNGRNVFLLEVNPDSKNATFIDELSLMTNSEIADSDFVDNMFEHMQRTPQGDRMRLNKDQRSAIISYVSKGLYRQHLNVIKIYDDHNTARNTANESSNPNYYISYFKNWFMGIETDNPSTGGIVFCKPTDSNMNANTLFNFYTDIKDPVYKDDSYICEVTKYTISNSAVLISKVLIDVNHLLPIICNSMIFANAVGFKKVIHDQITYDFGESEELHYGRKMTDGKILVDLTDEVKEKSAYGYAHRTTFKILSEHLTPLDSGIYIPPFMESLRSCLNITNLDNDITKEVNDIVTSPGIPAHIIGVLNAYISGLYNKLGDSLIVHRLDTGKVFAEIYRNISEFNVVVINNTPYNLCLVEKYAVTHIGILKIVALMSPDSIVEVLNSKESISKENFSKIFREDYTKPLRSCL